jgi:molecular chaperone GrpE
MRKLTANRSAEGASETTNKNKKADSSKAQKRSGKITADAENESVRAEINGEDAEVTVVMESEDDSGPVVTPEKELAVEKEKYLRLAAEYDNFRKRSAKEREVIYRDARADAITKLLPVFDNLERALRMDCADEPYYKGVEMIMGQLTEVLEDMGVKQIPAVGELFDPNRHNAVMKIEDPQLGENTIAEEYQKGFMLGERVIRFSTVVVAN